MNEIKRYVNQLTSTPSSGAFLHKRLPFKTNILMYDDLANVTDLDSVFKNDMFILFYPNGGGIGHWTCVCRYIYPNNQGNTYISYFDSYGNPPDHIRKPNQPKYLMALLYKEKLKGRVVEYSEIDYQQKKNSNACGYFVLWRALFRKYPLYIFQAIMEEIKNDDDIATLIAYFM